MNQHASNLIELTVRAFNGDVTSISPTDGMSLIDSWISFLGSEGGPAASVAGGLSELKTELQAGNPDSTSVERILNDLAKQTKQIAGSGDEQTDKSGLTTLAEALQGLHQLVKGSTKRASTGGQAPMTSTVGGESTNSGAGASALNTGDDDLSDRNGGTIR